MPVLNRDTLSKIQGGINDYPIFIESGTKYGKTAVAMTQVFDHVHTIEINPTFYSQAKRHYRGNRITFYCGDSCDVLPDIIPQIDQNAVFFLDGHWSEGDTGRGQKDCPLLEELSCIVSTFPHEAILIIDDFRLFEKGPNQMGDMYSRCDWEAISKERVMECIQSRLVNHYHLSSNLHPEDRLVIHLKGY